MSFYTQLKEFILGKSLPTSAHAEERLIEAAALALLNTTDTELMDINYYDNMEWKNGNNKPS